MGSLAPCLASARQTPRKPVPWRRAGASGMRRAGCVISSSKAAGPRLITLEVGELAQPWPCAHRRLRRSSGASEQRRGAEAKGRERGASRAVTSEEPLEETGLPTRGLCQSCFLVKNRNRPKWTLQNPQKRAR